MSKFVNPKRVTRRDRLIAYFLTGGLAFAIVILVLLEIIRIVQARHKPATMTTFLDGAEDKGGLPRWGRMPYLFVRSQKTAGSVLCPNMSDVYFADTGLGTHAEPTFKMLSEPQCENMGKGMVRVDFTTLVPEFGAGSSGGRGENVFEFPHPPTIDMRFVVEGTDGVDLFFAQPTAPKEAVSPPWQNSLIWMRYIGGIGDLSDTQGQYVHTHVSKGYQPREGVFWGFNLGDRHIEETMHFTYSGYHQKKVPLYTKSGTPKVNFGWRITISSKVVMEPISIVTQVFSLLSKVGGWLTMATAVFYIFFANKYPRSEEEQISQRLALRWKREHDRGVTSTIELKTMEEGLNDEEDDGPAYFEPTTTLNLAKGRKPSKEKS